MHYIIALWNTQTLKWEIVHYSHDIDDMQRMMTQFPDPPYVHLIDIKYLKSHTIMEQVQAVKEKFRKQAEEEKEAQKRAIEEKLKEIRGG